MMSASHQSTPYVFLSYASADRERALRIADLLETNGIAVWVDRRSIAGGTSWSGEIVEAIKNCGALVVLVSSAAMQSRNVQQEIQLAWEHDRPILPLRLDAERLPSSVEYVLAGRQWIEVLESPDPVWLSPVLRALSGMGLVPTGPAVEATTSPVDGDRVGANKEQVAPNNLPSQLTSFIGREREMGEIAGLIRQPAPSRLLTLTGTGGCGKTRLALQVAAQVGSEFADGVWLVDLAPVANASLVGRALATVLGVREDPDRPLLTTLVSFLRAKRLLLVVDNCEHVLDACAHLIDVVLRGCPNVCVLATSREALGIAGELGRVVPSLEAPPERHAAIDEVVRCEAVQLFVDRARVVQPSFEISERNATAVIQICRRLDGIPLAIELAAARLRAFSVEQVANRLDQRFLLLTGGSRAALPRQQTLAALVGWSYELLSEPQRVLFNRLSVFAGGFTLEAAEVVCGDGNEVLGARNQGAALSVLPVPSPAVFDLVAQLVDKSLVIMEPGNVTGEVRYRLLETLRQYADNRLAEAGDVLDLRERHATEYLGFAEQAESELRGPLQVEWLNRLEQEHDNLRAALGWWAEKRDADRAVRLAGALWRFWWAHGHIAEGREQLRTALSCRPSGGHAIGDARALYGAGTLATIQDAYSEASALLDEGVTAGRTVGDKRSTAGCLHQLGLVLFFQGYSERAHALLAESVALWREVGDAAGLTEALGYLGWLDLDTGNLAAARTALEESVTLRPNATDAIGAAFSLFVLGTVDLAEGKTTAAQARYEQSLAAVRPTGNRHVGAFGIAGLGIAALAEGSLTVAREHLAQALRLVQEAGDKTGILWLLDSYVRLTVAQARWERAVRLAGATAAMRERYTVRAGFGGWAKLEESIGRARELQGNQSTVLWAEGQAMTLEQAVAYALEKDGG